MVSIIIPSYNSSRTIRRCLQSVIRQTYRNIEIVVVDDGSTDGSSSMIDELLDEVEKKVIIHKQENEGVEKTRLKGINVSNGKYVLLLDADDILPDNAVDILVNTSLKYGADLVQGGMQTFVTLLGHKIKLSGNPSWVGVKTYEDNIVLRKVYLSFFGCGNFNAGVGGKFYKRDVLMDIKVAGLSFGEDLYMNMQVFPRLKCICEIPQITYYYERQGMTSRFMPQFMCDCKKLYQIKVDVAKEQHIDEAILYSTIELRNCLKTHVESMILHKVDSQEGIKQWIMQELQDSIYDVFDWLREQHGFNNSPIAQAIVNRNADSIYDNCHKSVYEWKPKKVARRPLTRI